MRARGCLLGLLGVLVGLALVAALVDTGARHYATSRITSRITQAAPESRGVRARIHSEPFLRVAVDGHLGDVSAHIDQLVEKPIVFSDVAVDLRGVRVDQSRLASEGKVVVTHIDTGRITLAVTPADFAAALGAPVSLADAAAGALAGHVRISVAPTRQLVVDVLGVHRFTFPLPGASVLPCLPVVTVTPARLELSCGFTRIPGAFTSLAS